MNSIDFKPASTSNIAEFNDMNTIVEFVSEIVLGKVNAFPEFTNRTQKQSQLQKHISFKIINNPLLFETEWVEQNNVTFCSKLTDNYTLPFINEINPPPPKA